MQRQSSLMKTTIANLVLAPNSMQRTIYLASPYGFSEQWKRLLLPEFIDALTALGLEVWEPFSRNGQIDFAQPGWAYRVAQKDLQDVRDAERPWSPTQPGTGGKSKSIYHG